MENPDKIHLNVCKSWSCPNLGVAGAADYLYPVYRLGYAALECQKCGSLPPLFNEREFNHWFARLTKNKPGASGAECPHCSASDVIRYGRTQAGNGRFQCRHCRGVFTPQQTKARFARTVEPFLLRLQQGDYAAETTQYRLLAKAVDWCERQPHHAPSEVKRVATTVLALPFQGQAAKQQLYVVISADACSGRLLLVSTNYSDEAVGDSLLYKGSASTAPQMAHECSVERLRQQEMQFMQRSQFDEIHYGSARLKRNDRGCILRPVIAIHGHFQRLKRCFPAITDHYLAHECVLRGGSDYGLVSGSAAWSDEFVVCAGGFQPAGKHRRCLQGYRSLEHWMVEQRLAALEWRWGSQVRLLIDRTKAGRKYCSGLAACLRRFSSLVACAAMVIGPVRVRGEGAEPSYRVPGVSL
ncbi:hypothetical protein PYX06_22595 [Citrobacter amalonaticus]|nr:hypothetical protein [Citrobacter amalonaticus]